MCHAIPANTCSCATLTGETTRDSSSVAYSGQFPSMQMAAKGAGAAGGVGGGGVGGGIGDSSSTAGMARSTGSHCGGNATGWLASTSLLATLGGGVMCGMDAAQKAAARPMRTSARELGVAFFAAYTR